MPRGAARESGDGGGGALLGRLPLPPPQPMTQPASLDLTCGRGHIFVKQLHEYLENMPIWKQIFVLVQTPQFICWHLCLTPVYLCPHCLSSWAARLCPDFVH